jgi:hypothetical protein
MTHAEEKNLNVWRLELARCSNVQCTTVNIYSIDSLLLSSTCLTTFAHLADDALPLQLAAKALH